MVVATQRSIGSGRAHASDPPENCAAPFSAERIYLHVHLWQQEKWPTSALCQRAVSAIKVVIALWEVSMIDAAAENGDATGSLARRAGGEINQSICMF